MKATQFELANGSIKNGSGGETPIHFDQVTKIVTTCWELNDADLMEIINKKRIFICSQVRNEQDGLQPVMPCTKFPPM